MNVLLSVVKFIGITYLIIFGCLFGMVLMTRLLFLAI